VPIIEMNVGKQQPEPLTRPAAGICRLMGKAPRNLSRLEQFFAA
jgi:hypothetical protein